MASVSCLAVWVVAINTILPFLSSSSPHRLPSATVINPTKPWSRRNVNHETPRFKTISKRATDNQSAYLKQSQSHDVCSASHAPRPLSCHRPVTHRSICHLSQKFRALIPRTLLIKRGRYGHNPKQLHQNLKASHSCQSGIYSRFDEWVK